VFGHKFLAILSDSSTAGTWEFPVFVRCIKFCRQQCSNSLFSRPGEHFLNQ